MWFLWKTAVRLQFCIQVMNVTITSWDAVGVLKHQGSSTAKKSLDFQPIISPFSSYFRIE